MKTFSDAQLYSLFLDTAKTFLGKAKESLAAGEEIDTIALLMKRKPDGKLEIGIAPLSMLPSKDMVKPMIRHLVGELGTEGVALISDVYMAKLPEGDPMRETVERGGKRVQDVPGRQEALILQLEMKEEITHTVYEQYNRNPDGTITWLPTVENYTDEDIGNAPTGRMAGFFS